MACMSIDCQGEVGTHEPTMGDYAVGKFSMNNITGIGIESHILAIGLVGLTTKSTGRPSVKRIDDDAKKMYYDITATTYGTLEAKPDH